MAQRAGKLIRELDALDRRHAELSKIDAPCGHPLTDYFSAYDCETRENAEMCRCRKCGHLWPEAELLKLRDGR